MAIMKDASGRRTVQLELALPATPEEVWRAIATGPGISSWFAPTDVEEREGGAVAFQLGPGMDSVGRVTSWEPPRRFAYEERDWAPNAPPLATEFTIEASSGSTCVLRLVHSLFTDAGDWDGQLEGIESGWLGFFDVLRLYLSDFAGQPSATFRVTAAGAGAEPEQWEVLSRALGLAARAIGERPRTADANVPRFDGVIERVVSSPHHEALVKLDHPTKGAGLFGVYSWDGKVFSVITLFLYGDDAADVAARDEPLWRAWMEQTLDAVTDRP